MIEVKCTVEADLDNEVITKSYTYKFDGEVIHKEDLENYFQRVIAEFISEDD